MDEGALSKYRKRVRSTFEDAFAETHTPHQVAGSFSIGVFITTLPSLGLGLVFFLFLTRLSDRISPIAIFSSALVINPLVKSPMFIAAFWIGSRLLGPVALTSSNDLADAAAIAARMISGFVVIGVVVAVVGYIIVYVLVTQYRKREIGIVEEVIDDELLND
jgi:uncharacterized protein (DUF2062 family)